ncbi:uncharacterized protein FPRO_05715 [Fusarium proliferatum ET1]|uniref:Uncharacterized protein n=1 Tax=Fusarium proliferatum (strain ET1) TaxID=1227346 RepID=A0A1L7VEI7_FUSPR|nr:uncharacterized protein FPRO_05715 [Fusarium proliferatum ET1]CZR39093.1 uncharacterized protein FPRO_05715 [Fusarium proliferatum ET1]
MNNPWRLDDIVTWAIDDNQNERLTFAHIQGPPASRKAIRLPRKIIESPRILDHRRTIIVQILPDFKRNVVVEGRGSWSPNHELKPGQRQPKLKVETYRESETMPDAEADRIIFLIEADPDYSAEYALTLATITSFALRKTSIQRALHIKIATVSWEGIHPVTKQLFHQYSSLFTGVSEFLLAKYEREPAQPVILKEMPSDLLKYGTVSNDSGTICLRFRDAMYDAEDQDEGNTLPSQWDPWITMSTTNGHYTSFPPGVKEPGLKLQMIHLNANARIAELLPPSYSVSIFASPTVRRVIFDRRSHQLLHTFLWISESEKLQQLSWLYRSQSYHSPDVLCLDHFTKHRATERRMKIRNEHAEGFMAALLDYTQWPATIWDLLKIVRRKDDVFAHVGDRFIFQGLTLSPQDRPKLPPKLNNGRAFYSLLPQIDYDSRIAYFLTLESSPLIAMMRVRFAALLMSGNESLELLHVQRLDSGTKTAIQECLKGCSLVCDPGSWVHLSTLWATAGLASMIDADDGEDRAMTPLADGSIRVVTLASAFLSHFSQALDRILRANGMEVMELATFRESVNYENYMQISRDLLRVYSHQVAFTSKPRRKLKEGELPLLNDFMTKKIFNPNLNLAVIDWDYLFTQEKTVYGVYTHLKRLGNGGTTVCNWTWIPSGVWNEFQGEMEKVRKMKGRGDEKNSDEFWQTRF